MKKGRPTVQAKPEVRFHLAKQLGNTLMFGVQLGNTQGCSDDDEDDMSIDEEKFIQEQLDRNLDFEKFAELGKPEVWVTSEEQSDDPDLSPQIGPSCSPYGVSFPASTPDYIKESWHTYEEALEVDTSYEEALEEFHWIDAVRRNKPLPATSRKHAVQPRKTRAPIRQLTTQFELESLIEDSLQAIEKLDRKEPDKFPRLKHDQVQHKTVVTDILDKKADRKLGESEMHKSDDVTPNTSRDRLSNADIKA